MNDTAIDQWTVSRALANQAAHKANDEFIRAAAGGSLTFGQADLLATRVANALEDLGLQGQRILLMARNSLEFATAWFGLSRAGCVLVPVNTSYRGDFLKSMLLDSKATTIIVDGEFLEELSQMGDWLAELEHCFVIGCAATTNVPGSLAGRLRRYDDLQAGPSTARSETVSHGDLAAILYTSGTSGRSKGVLLPHGHLYLNAHLFLEQLRVTEADTIYCCLPLFHLNGLTLQLLCGLLAGSRVVLARTFSASNWLPEIRRHGASLTNLLGSMTEFVFAQSAAKDDRHNPLRAICAVPIMPRIGAAFEARFGAKLIELYGTTEITCPIYMPYDERLRDGSCGKLISEWFEARIVDPESDRELPVGTVGELVVRPKVLGCFMQGYFGMPEATVSAWRNLWFHTGDAMRLDEDGYYYFVDRMKDCLRRKGENISSFEVEQVILGHAAVAEVAVVGLRSPFREGEDEVKACVVLKPDAESSPEELVAHCRTRMPAFAVPGLIEFLPSLPLTATGKVRKEVLRSQGITAATWTDTALLPREQGAVS